jgi:hypothetical protein
MRWNTIGWSSPAMTFALLMPSVQQGSVFVGGEMNFPMESNPAFASQRTTLTSLLLIG